MKKILLFTFAFIFSFLMVSCGDMSEDEFNASGRAKAILDESDLWMVYEDEDAGLEFKYPLNVSMEEGSDFLLTVESSPIDILEGTMGFDKETAEINMKELANGEYGTDVDFPFEASKEVRKLGSVNAQEFVVLGRFEVCDVRFEKKLYFFNAGNQIVITLSTPIEKLIEESPVYFTTDEANCGEQKIWNFDNQNMFWENIVNKKDSQTAQDALKAFDDIANTINVK
ncbi:hypothetical protein JW758_00395 [Candidatus Peregrinibacteria bacterium]|nr:hypothetical protein [Candidatus Peregrinibacteria bacterium]